jgi:hypothetical protein
VPTNLSQVGINVFGVSFPFVRTGFAHLIRTKRYADRKRNKKTPDATSVKRERKTINHKRLQVAEAGIEPDSVSGDAASGLRQSQSQSGTESGTVGGDSAQLDPDLATLVVAWPSLPETTRQSIVAMIRGAIS